MKKTKCILLFLVVFSFTIFSGDLIAFDANQTATREEVYNNLLIAAHGNYYWHRGGTDQKPFMPKGFPQWNGSKNDVRKIMGSPSKELTIYNLPADEFSHNYFVYKNDKLVAIGYTSSFRDLRDISFNRESWRNVSEPDDPADCYFADFSTYSNYSRTVRIASWKGKEKVDGGLLYFVGLREFARDQGITNQ